MVTRTDSLFNIYLAMRVIISKNQLKIHKFEFFFKIKSSYLLNDLRRETKMNFVCTRTDKSIDAFIVDALLLVIPFTHPKFHDSSIKRLVIG